MLSLSSPEVSVTSRSTTAPATPTTTATATATAPATTAASRRNHVWSSAEIEQLVDLLHKNPRYQIALLPGRNTKEQEKGQKVSKSTLCRQIFTEIFGPDEQPNVQRIKTKITTLVRVYTHEMKKLGATGSGLLWDEIEHGSEVSGHCEAVRLTVLNIVTLCSLHQIHQERTNIAKRHPWFERWHEMSVDRPAATPSRLLLAGTNMEYLLNESYSASEANYVQSLNEEAIDVTGWCVQDRLAARKGKSRGCSKGGGGERRYKRWGENRGNSKKGRYLL